MPVSLWRAIPLHRTINADLYADLAVMVSLPGGFPAWRLDDDQDSLQIDGQMRTSYAGQNFTLAVIWTVVGGTVGTLTLPAAFRRHILGTNAFLPYCVAQTMSSGAPAAHVPTVTSRVWTQAETAPQFPGGLGGLGAGDKFRLSVTRSGLAGAAYILGIDMWVA